MTEKPKFDYSQHGLSPLSSKIVNIKSSYCLFETASFGLIKEQL